MVQFLKKTAFAGVPFGLIMGLLFTFQSRHPLGFAFGLAAGLFFGLCLAAFAEWQRSRFTLDPPVLCDEHLLMHGPANHFRGLEGVGGWLVLTDKRLLFRPHRFIAQKQELAIPLGEIQKAESCSTAWVIPNGLRVTSTQGQDRFVVEGRRNWVDGISQAMSNPPDPALQRTRPTEERLG
jgi:hypothetical protein